MKNKRGITLIALIITIVILLILAGITISAVMGDNGLLTQAMKSKTNTDEAQAKEMLGLAWSARMVKFLEEKNKIIDDTYLNELIIDLNDNIGSNGKIQGIKYNPATSLYSIVYENNDGNNYIVQSTISGDMTIENTLPIREDVLFELADNYILAEGLNIDEILQEIATPQSAFSFQIYNSTTAYITGLNDRSLTRIVIPSVYKVSGSNYTITKIESSAFKECNNLTNIIISNGITTIGYDAFRACANLESVTIPNTVTTIERWAFGDNPSLKSIVLPSSLTNMGEFSTFAMCTNLTDVTILNGLTTICNTAFSNCNNLTNLVIPDSVTTINGGAFQGCTNLKNVKMSNCLTTISSGVFHWCSALNTIILPRSLTSIGEWAFNGCTTLTTVYYTGTQSEWSSIVINERNESLVSATKVYNYVGN